MAASPSGVRSRDDLASYLEGLAREAEAAPPDWENDTLPRYISGAARWVADMDGWFRNQGREVPEEPDWELVAAIFLAATAYE